MHLHCWGKGWAFFIGYYEEFNSFRLRLACGGKAKVRAANGLFPYGREFILDYYRDAGPRLRYFKTDVAALNARWA